MTLTPLSDDASPEDQQEIWPRKTIRIAALIVVLATILLWLPALVWPMLKWDDFCTITRSWPAPVLQEKLWEPHNEHVMPLTRILTYGLVEIAGSVAALPLTLAFVGPILVLLCMGTMYLFIRRELDDPFYALLAMMLLGITSQYGSAVRWYAANYFVMSVLFTLLALLFAQRWSHHGSAVSLAICALLMAMAPAWSAVGLLGGPLCSLYLWIPDRKQKYAWPFWKRTLIACIPTLGTGLFLAITLPMAGEQINHTGHYGNRTAVEFFAPMRGLEYTLRSLVDNVVLGTVDLLPLTARLADVWERRLSLILVVPLLIAGVWWYRKAPSKRLVLLGLGFILCNYFLIYGARASGWRYERIRMWGRYQVFPHCGMVLMLIGGLPHWHAWLLRQSRTRGQRLRWAGLGLLILFFGIHLPRTWPGYYDPKQKEQLKQIDAMNELCIRHRISREQAWDALPHFDVIASVKREGDNGWFLLRGSTNPVNRSREEIQKLLEPALPPALVQRSTPP